MKKESKSKIVKKAAKKAGLKCEELKTSTVEADLKGLPVLQPRLADLLTETGNRDLLLGFIFGADIYRKGWSPREVPGDAFELLQAASACLPINWVFSFWYGSSKNARPCVEAYTDTRSLLRGSSERTITGYSSTVTDNGGLGTAIVTALEDYLRSAPIKVLTKMASNRPDKDLVLTALNHYLLR